MDGKLTELLDAKLKKSFHFLQLMLNLNPDFYKWANK